MGNINVNDNEAKDTSASIIPYGYNEKRQKINFRAQTVIGGRPGPEIRYVHLLPRAHGSTVTWRGTQQWPTQAQGCSWARTQAVSENVRERTNQETLGRTNQHH